MIQEILIQAGYYFVAMSIGVFIFGIMLKGVFWKLVKVRLSFGRLILVKVRQIHRDFLIVGEVDDGFLVFGKKGQQKRVTIPGNEFIYRVGGMQWIDVDEETGAVCGADYIGVSGFDPVKYNNLYVRTLFKPSVADNQEKIIIGALGLAIILIVVVGFLVYKNGYSLTFLTQAIGQVVQTGQGVITNT